MNSDQTHRAGLKYALASPPGARDLGRDGVAAYEYRSSMNRATLDPHP